MYPELSFDVIAFPCVWGIVVYQETFFQSILYLNLLGRNCLASDFPRFDPGWQRQSDQSFYTHLPAMTTFRIPLTKGLCLSSLLPDLFLRTSAKTHNLFSAHSLLPTIHCFYCVLVFCRDGRGNYGSVVFCQSALWDELFTNVSPWDNLFMLTVE